MSAKRIIKRYWALGLVASFSLVVFVAINAAQASAVEIDNSILRGGRLYDNWIAEMKERDPFPRSHPAYPKNSKFAGQPERTWRCVECHGWDYMGKDGSYGQGAHYTGIKGIQKYMGANPARIIAIMKNDTHSYQDQVLFDEDDFKDLAAFVSKGQVDMDMYIDRKTRKAKGDSSKHQTYYQTICSTCHGTDGAKIRTMLPLGKIANDNPWEALHNMLNGHPNAEMPSLRLLGMDVLIDILAYIQTFPSEYLQASIVRGGRLYDSWFDEIDVKPSVGRHTYYPAKGYYAMKPSATWRCRECHGWDYKGKDGAYGKGKHFTGIKGIGGSVGKDQETIVNVLTNPPHNYRNLMDMRDILDLANFVLKGQIDMDEYIDPQTKRSRGNKKNSAAIYNTYCLHCHGADGEGVGDALPLGNLSRSNPWKALHSIMNGHPNETMPPLRVIGKQVIMDMLAYIQTLGS